MKNKQGYIQAIQNYAYQMAKISDTIDNGDLPDLDVITEMDNEEEIQMMFDKIDIPEDAMNAFQEMDNIIQVIAETYDVDPDTAMADGMRAGIELAMAQAQAELLQGPLH